MEREFIKLKKEFERIKNMGYVESTRGGTTGIGKTFEDLIGKKEDSLPLPDYDGIEIKTKRAYSKSYITLFTAAPNGKGQYEIKRLIEKYGYPDRIIKSSKVLYADVYANHSTIIANRYLFKLNIDYNTKKLYLNICDLNMKNFDTETYWDFDVLETKLNQKLKKLALIKAWPNKKNEKIYYKYFSIEFYKIKDFNTFIKLIENGDIRIGIKISTYRTGQYKGNICDRGTSFGIKSENLDKLFTKVIV
jgi:hypothetical protein